jgi:FtsH-binding integral membrane protein
VAALMFLAYSFLTGLTLSGLFWYFKLGSVASAFFVTAGAFAALSAYATVTKRDLSAFAKFLFIGLVGLVLASLVSLFVHSGLLVFVINCVGVLVFGGLTAVHTQQLRRYYATSGYRSAQALAVNGALMLYLDFINLFLSILSLTGRRRDQ